MEILNFMYNPKEAFCLSPVLLGLICCCCCCCCCCCFIIVILSGYEIL